MSLLKQYWAARQGTKLPHSHVFPKINAGKPCAGHLAALLTDCKTEQSNVARSNTCALPPAWTRSSAAVWKADSRVQP